MPLPKQHSRTLGTTTMAWSSNPFHLSWCWPKMQRMGVVVVVLYAITHAPLRAKAWTSRPCLLSHIFSTRDSSIRVNHARSVFGPVESTRRRPDVATVLWNAAQGFGTNETAFSSRSDRRRKEKIQIGSNNKASIYSMPALYDLAFGYRDFEDEVAFLLREHKRLTASSSLLSTTKSLTVLELAAGPARHAAAAVRHHCTVDPTIHVGTMHCLDVSTEMAEYAQTTVFVGASDDNDIPFEDEEHGVMIKPYGSLQYHVGDMTDFDWPLSTPTKITSGNADALVSPSNPEGVDTAWLLLGSLQHVLTNAEVIRCFRSVARALTADGTLFVELPHPRETLLRRTECTRNGWIVPLDMRDDDDDGEEKHLQEEEDDEIMDDPSRAQLKVVWGDEDDAFDPIAQVRQFTVQFDLTTGVADDPDNVSLHQIVPMRLFTAQEIDALATCAGLRVVQQYGALEDGVAVDDNETAFRLVCALQKV